MNEYILKALQYHIKRFHLKFSDPEKYWIYLRQNNIKVLYPEHPLFPIFWKQGKPKSRCVLYQGDLSFLSGKIFSVIGGRNLEDINRKWMQQELGNLLKSKNYIICSGAANGVDQLSHKICLWHKRKSIAILPCGFNNLYPQSFSDLLSEESKKHILLMSEYPPEEEVRKHYFAERNRLIVGLGNFTLGIQAKRNSGTSMSLRLAREMGKEVLCLPAHPYELRMQAANDFIFSGASLVRDVKDLEVIAKQSFSKDRVKDI